MVLVSMIIQGTTIMPLARLLKLDQPTDDRERLPLELESTPASSGHEMKEFTVPANAPYIGKTIAELELPRGVLITLVRRGKQLVQPNGATRIEAGDGLLMLGKHRLLNDVERSFFS